VDVPAPVVVLPSAADGDAVEPVLDITGAPAAGGGASEEPGEERSEWNRRLGTLALSGAAAVSALVLALALGGGRVPVTVIRGGGQVPVGVPGIVQGGGVDQGPFGAGTLGGSGYEPGAVDEPVGPEGGGTEGPGSDVGLGGDLANPGNGGSDEPAPPVEEPGGDGGNGGGGGNDGGGGGAEPSDGLPGKSADHNPHGGPPGQLGTTPAHGPGLGANLTGEHSSEKHAHKH
jgi:hypothetical protein